MQSKVRFNSTKRMDNLFSAIQSPEKMCISLPFVSSHPTNGSLALSNNSYLQMKAPFIYIVLFVENSVTKLTAYFPHIYAISCTNNTKQMIATFPLFVQNLSFT